jgi:hypothetical protein
MQFNARTTPQTVEALYEIADQQGWLVGETLEHACLMTFRSTKGRRNRWERVAALSTAARDGSGVR